MPEPSPLLVFIRPLNALGLPYMVTGSVASIYYGEPRLTHDVDIVLQLSSADAVALVHAFPPGGFYCPPLEAIVLESTRPGRGHFNLIHHQTGFRADVYLSGRDPLHRWGMDARREGRIGGVTVWFAPPEYVVLRKLEYYREGGSEKHLRDIAAMLTVSGDQIGLPDLESRVRCAGLDREWVKARNWQ